MHNHPNQKQQNYQQNDTVLTKSNFNGSENRRLSRKYFGEPQCVGGKPKPSSQDDMRRKRAAYFERLLSGTS